MSGVILAECAFPCLQAMHTALCKTAHGALFIVLIAGGRCIVHVAAAVKCARAFHALPNFAVWCSSDDSTTICCRLKRTSKRRRLQRWTTRRLVRVGAQRGTATASGQQRDAWRACGATETHSGRRHTRSRSTEAHGALLFGLAAILKPHRDRSAVSRSQRDTCLGVMPTMLARRSRTFSFGKAFCT